MRFAVFRKTCPGETDFLLNRQRRARTGNDTGRKRNKKTTVFK